MMKDAKADLIWGLIWAFVGAFVLIYSASYGMVESLDPVGPGYLPRMLGLGIVLLGLGMALESYAKYRKALAERQAGQAEEAGGEEQSSPGGAMRIIWSAISAIAYLALVEPLGFLISTPLFIAAIMLIYGDRNRKRLLWMSLGFTTILYATFAVGLKVLLPMGFIASFFE